MRVAIPARSDVRRIAAWETAAVYGWVMSSNAHTQSLRSLTKAVDAAPWVLLTTTLTGVIAGVVAFGEGVPAAGLGLVAGFVLLGEIGFMLCCWARVWLHGREASDPPSD